VKRLPGLFSSSERCCPAQVAFVGLRGSGLATCDGRAAPGAPLVRGGAFGDGPRIPLIAVSKYSRGGKVVHSYGDHASLVKFIERNWQLQPLTDRSRDNLPSPIQHHDSYVPENMPAVGDLFDMFDFHHGDDPAGD
jgi:hypothetical protein